MKRILSLALLVVLLASFAVLPAAAKSPVVKGEVTAIVGNTITVLTRTNQSVNITAPMEFDLTTLAVGDNILAKGVFKEDGSLAAAWIHKIGSVGEDEDASEGGKAANSAFCDPAKQQRPHPMAVRLADKFGVTTDWVMGYYCDGYSIGAILLALKTSQLTTVNADDLLALRSGGQSWGSIWQEEKLIGSERDVNPPPGWLHKPSNPGH